MQTKFTAEQPQTYYPLTKSPTSSKTKPTTQPIHGYIQENIVPITHFELRLLTILHPNSTSLAHQTPPLLSHEPWLRVEVNVVFSNL